MSREVIYLLGCECKTCYRHYGDYFYSVTGLADSSVAPSFRQYDAHYGVDALDAGLIAVLKHDGKSWQFWNSVRTPGLAVSMTGSGDLAMLVNADSSINRYAWRTMRILLNATQGGAPAASP